MVEPGAPVVLDQGGQVGDAGERRVRAALLGAQRGDRGADLVEAGPADGLGVDQGRVGLGEVAATQHVAGAGDVQEHGGQRVPGEVVQLAGDAPPLLGHGLVGERLTGALELVDQPALLDLRAAEREDEEVGHRPRLPRDAGVGRQHLGDDQRHRRRQRP